VIEFVKDKTAKRNGPKVLHCHWEFTAMPIWCAISLRCQF